MKEREKNWNSQKELHQNNLQFSESEREKKGEKREREMKAQKQLSLNHR